MLSRHLNILKIFTFGCLFAIGLTACNMFQRDLDWTEDVILNDGRIIRLKRHQEFKGPHSLDQPPSASAYWIEFKHPDTGEKIRWANEMNLAAVALLIENGEFWLLTTPKYVSSWNMYGRPIPPYILYKYRNNWIRLPLHEAAIKKIKINLTTDPKLRMVEIKESEGHLNSAQTFETSFMGCPSCVINLDGVKFQQFNSKQRTDRDYLLEKQGKQND